MEERLSRAEILQRLAIEQRRLLDTLSHVKPEQHAQSGVVGIWSVKEMLAHLIFWNAFALQELQAAVAGKTVPHPEGTGDEINARAVAAYADWSADAVQQAFEQSCTEVLDTVKHLPDSAFEADSSIEQMLNETVHGALANNTYEHWPIHEAQIRAWLVA